MSEPPVSALRWPRAWRLVASRFPPETLFDRVADADELAVVTAIEGLTNDRLREELGELHRVPAEQRIFGPGSTPVMASFTHVPPQGSRFSDGTYGVYYAGHSLDVAVAETRYHRERFLARTSEPACEVDMRAYVGSLAGQLHDIRGGWPEYHRPDDYAPSQRWARGLRDSGADGIMYDSVRLAGGECVAMFKPNLVAPVSQGPHLSYAWDGERIARVFEKRAL